ncbi:olfactory receptor 51E2-like [Latimeria chalumnae]|uniref:olfactory receptor 51E2-like n=1 Tax=Latimeria chalumnae TaxID=7897 RepID=UPI00313E62A3
MAVLNLAVVDVVYNTTLIPKALQAFLFNSNYIGFDACFTQCFFAHYAVAMESFSLVIIAYDRFVAICFPLQYPSINTSTKMFIIIASSFIFLTYVAVFIAIIKLDSAVSRRKPIRTCITHLILVLIFYVPLMVNYMLIQISFSYSYNVRSLSTALASTLPPMLNPIIYSFSTEEVQRVPEVPLPPLEGHPQRGEEAASKE